MLLSGLCFRLAGHLRLLLQQMIVPNGPVEIARQPNPFSIAVSDLKRALKALFGGKQLICPRDERKKRSSQEPLGRDSANCNSAPFAARVALLRQREEGHAKIGAAEEEFRASFK